MQDQEIIKQAQACLDAEANAIKEMKERIGSAFAEAVKAISACRGKVVVTGVGKSGHIGSKIAATLASTGTPAFFLNPLDAYHGDLGMLSGEDIVLAISYSGATEELLRFLPLIQAKGIQIIGMSSTEDSLLARYSSIHLNIAVAHEADPLNLIPTASTTATLAMGDALACALIEAKHFQPSDFARLHPGGDLGRKLLGKVEDVMFKENLPFVTPAMKMSDAIEIVTQGTLGIGIVVEHEEMLVGIITDGDIRRAMQRLGKEFFDTPVSEIMSRNPKTISKDAKIVEAGEKMNHYSIHTLIVVEPSEVSNQPSAVVGVVDSFSCLPGTRFYH
ncbi:MAG: KpsF/GutQ family sugar-phosphate isomerase [Paludibacteraceae bacterium]|jgi:arabinose-5-phosphate isomerase|nr:KpsF/GutQ family sugar-phosphate isomerase [Paludibacteraceae bacterium]MBR1716091.1 KpsF/GutQ family sugar-phosphate isomerase [Paludibacteraceae bacterium]